MTEAKVAKQASERGDPRAEHRIEEHGGHLSGRPTRESEKEVCLRVEVHKEQSERHAYGRSRGHVTSMQKKESRWVTDDGGPTEPTKRQA